MVLQAPPTAVVNIDVTSSDAAKGIAAPGMLTFDANDWYVPQTVTVTGQAGARRRCLQHCSVAGDQRGPGLPGPGSGGRAGDFAGRPSRQSFGRLTTLLQVGASPLLQVAVTNAAPGNLTVTFYGREAATVFPGRDFCIAVMPDTQMYTGELDGGKKEMMIAQTEWAISNRLSRNVAYVTQLGDISNNGDNPTYVSQWYNATNAMYRLESPARTQLPYGMAYGVAVGNHEFSPIGNAAVGTTSNYNRYFGVSHFAGRDVLRGPLRDEQQQSLRFLQRERAGFRGALFRV